MVQTPVRENIRLAALALSLMAVASCADNNPNGLVTNVKIDNLNKEEPAPAPQAPQYIVIYKDGAQGLADESNATGQKLGDMVYTNASVFADSDPALLASDPNVEQVVENFISYPTAPYPTNAFYFVNNWQWSMKQIKADLVPEAVQGQGARVCIIDSGLDATHQDLLGKMVAHTSFVDIAHGYPGPGASPAPLDSNGHGSHVAGTVTSNGVRVAPVAPRAMLMSAKVFPATGGASLAAIWDAIDWCVLNGADVINMSLGGIRTRPLSAANLGFKATYEAKIQNARDNGVVVVVAAGNDNLNMNPASPQETWPAELAGTVTVSASAAANQAPFVGNWNFPWPFPPPHAAFDQKASYSNHGVGTDIWAPGGSNIINRIQSQVISVCSSYRNGGACKGGKYYMSISGTSMASPHTAGVAALLTSRTVTPKGLARTVAIENCLYSSGDPITILGVTRPRLNALRAATEACAGI